MPGLIFQIRAGGIAEAVTLAAIARSEAVGHGERGRIGEAPIFADSAVQPFGAGFGCFDRQRLQAVGINNSRRLFGFFGAVANAGAGGDDEKREVIAPAIRCGGRT